MRTLATSAVVASDFYISYVALNMLTSLQQALVFSMTIFIYLVVFYRKELPMLATTQPYRHANAMPMPQVRQGTTQQAGTVTPEQRVINGWLYSNRVSIQATTATTTPDYEIYNLVKAPGASWSLLTKQVLLDLAYEVYAWRGGGEPINIIFNEMPAYLRVTRRERESLPWSSRLNDLPAYTAQVGASLNGTAMQLVKVNLVEPTTNTPKDYLLGIFSSSGGGKSNVLRAAALSVMLNADPANTEFFFIDLDSNQFDDWQRLPHVRYVAGNEAEALALLNLLVEQMEGNRSMTSKTRRFLVIDELQMLTAQSDHADTFCDLLGKLAQRWRKHGGCMLLATQDPTGNNYPTALQRNTKIVMAGLTEDSSYLKRFFGIEGADKLRGDGDFLIKAAGKQGNFKAFFLTPQDIAQTLDAIVSRWGEDYSTLAFEQDEPTDEPGAMLRMPTIKRSRIEMDAEVIQAYLDEAYDYNTGRLRDGWGVKLLEVLYERPVANAGNYKKRLDDAVNFCLTNLT